MSLYEKYSWQIPVDVYIADLERCRIGGTSKFSALNVASSVPLARFCVAVCHYLQGNLRHAIAHGRHVGPEVLEYFYGAWRRKVPTDLGTLDPGWWHGKTNWQDHFSFGICWATAIGDWETVRKLAEYPTADCIVEPGTTKESKALYILFAGVLRGEPLAAQQASLATIQSGKKQKPKILTNALFALERRNKAAFQDAVNEYLRFFRKHEFKRTSLDKLLSVDGTSIINVGLRFGLSISVSSEHKDFIIYLH